MFLSRRSGGFYYLWYEDEFGRRRKISTKTTRKPEAVEFLRTFKRETEVKVEPKRLSEFTKEFLAFTQTTYAVHTNDLYQRVLHLLEKQVGDIPIAAVTTRHIDRYKSIKLRTVKPVSVNIELRALRAAFATAKRWKLITENPCSEVKQIPVPDEPPIFFTVADFEKLIAVMEQRWLRELVGAKRGKLLRGPEAAGTQQPEGNPGIRTPAADADARHGEQDFGDGQSVLHLTTGEGRS